MSIEGDPRISEAELAAEDAAIEAFDDGVTENALQAAEADIAEFQQDCVMVHEFLNQDTYWVDVHGRRHAIRDMSVHYKANCLTFMRKRVHWFAHRYPWGAIFALDLPSGLRTIGPGDVGIEGGSHGRSVSRGEAFLDDGGNMSAAFDEYTEALFDRIKRDPEAWLDDTTLMKALSDQVLAGEGGAVGDRPQDQSREVPGATPCPKCSKPAHVSAQHRRSGPLARLCTGEWVHLR